MEGEAGGRRPLLRPRQRRRPRVLPTRRRADPPPAAGGRLPQARRPVRPTEDTFPRFSQRRDEIEELLAESGYDSPRARQAATLATRQAKDYAVTADTLVEEWRTRAAAAGFGSAEVADCFGRVASNEATARAETLRRLAGPTGITERSSTFTRRDVIRWVANDAGGGLSAPVVEHLADRFLASDAVPLIHDGQRGRAQLVLGSDGRMVRTGGLATFTTPEISTSMPVSSASPVNLRALPRSPLQPP